MNAPVIETLVIGSGFGGSVVAARLAEAGVQVTLLERGPWWDTVPTRSMGVEHRAPLPRGMGLLTRFLRGANASWLPGGRVTLNRRGLIEWFGSPGMEVLCASGVGGGSHVYSAVHRRPAREDYWDGVIDGISETTMAPHAEAFLTRMGSTKAGEHNRPPNTAMERFHNDPHFEPAVPKVPVLTGFLLPENPANPKRIVDANGVERWETDYAANDAGFLGSPSGAKTTLDIAYLAPAMRKGLEIRDMCEAVTIRRTDDAGARYEVEIRDLRRHRRESLRAEHVVLAAGTMNTLRLLLHSRDKAGGLDGMANLGKRFSGNGDIRGFWDMNEPDTDISTGLPSKGSILLRDGDEPRAAISRNSLPSIDAYPLPKKWRERLKRGHVVSGMGIDAADGVISMSAGGKLAIDFDPANSPVYARIHATMMEMAQRSGAKLHAGRRPSTVHPMGGACVGPLEAGGVVDAAGEVHGHPGLFVADAAALPAPTGAPPTQTIATWAEHVAKGFAG